MILSRVFVDTGAWFALQVEDDEHHETARMTFPTLLVACRSLVTSNLIIGETYTLLRTAKNYPGVSQKSPQNSEFYPHVE
jgi:predicted nucleic acid-binding protein